eukprot:364924-Chlamydomonas_euryale.AAC.9
MAPIPRITLADGRLAGAFERLVLVHPSWRCRVRGPGRRRRTRLACPWQARPHLRRRIMLVRHGPRHAQHPVVDRVELPKPRHARGVGQARLDFGVQLACHAQRAGVRRHAPELSQLQVDHEQRAVAGRQAARAAHRAQLTEVLHPVRVCARVGGVKLKKRCGCGPDSACVCVRGRCEI